MSFRETFRIDITKLKANADVLDLTGAERAGLLWLVMAQWQSPDCYLPKDEEFLRKASGLGDEWFTAKKAIMRMFREDDFGVYEAETRYAWVCAKELNDRIRVGAKRAVQVRMARRLVASALPVDGAYAKTAQDIAPQKGKSSVTTDRKSAGEVNERKPSGLSDNESREGNCEEGDEQFIKELTKHFVERATAANALDSDILPRQEKEDDGKPEPRYYVSAGPGLPMYEVQLYDGNVLRGGVAPPEAQQEHLEAPIDRELLDLEALSDSDDDLAVIQAAKANAGMLDVSRVRRPRPTAGVSRWR